MSRDISVQDIPSDVASVEDIPRRLDARSGALFT